ncbi:hypothetical protein ACFSAV_07350 [Pasteurella oralis]|uniref:Transmembrane protein n=1 Tax=Pasteurella oralis TaxID=1071947 RepID=A0ABW4NV43_9PAST
MHIKHWKKIAFVVSFGVHFYLWQSGSFAGFTLDETHELSNNLFSISATLIGFIFAIVAILVTITENPLIKKMRKNGMYSEIIDHLGYLIAGFSITMLLSYTCLLFSGELLNYLLICTSFIFMYSMLMLITDMFKRLKLTFRNLD